MNAAPAATAEAAAPEWTHEHVCELMVKARLAFNGVGLIISGGEWGRPATVDAEFYGDRSGEFAPSVLKVIHWLTHATPEEYVVMYEHLKWKAGGYRGLPWADVLRKKRWSKDYAKDKRKAFCKREAARLNRLAIPWFDLTPDGAVTHSPASIPSGIPA